MSSAYGSAETGSRVQQQQEFDGLPEQLVLEKTGLQVVFDVYRDEQDFADMYVIWQEIIAEGQTYPQDTATEQSFRQYFFSHHSFVFRLATSGQTIGGFYIKPNFPGRSAHLANVGLAIKMDYRSHGLGSYMMERVVKYGKLIGSYEALYTNLVYCSNLASIALCKKYGFREVGRLPRAGNLNGHGYVDALQLYRDLQVD
ncbi:uncharacterized protein LOC128962308 [Oppia nitens]|uniref:uncharacterized protein LOC128962308 n=1 Tax=Oppia nitens TaxID=1686743 RepID=UPI0023DA9C73|nr:uncharacterized protein LOC128962308 [Oppia nitens]